MSISTDGYINDRAGAFDWSVPTEELFRFHLDRVSALGGCLLGRRLYETMVVWETDPAMREGELNRAFADAWAALPKVVFSRTLTEVAGNATLATGTLADEVAAMRASTERDVETGGADLAGQAISAGLVDELQLFRYPIIVGGGTALLPPVSEPIPLDLVESRVFSERVLFERFRCAD